MCNQFDQNAGLLDTLTANKFESNACDQAVTTPIMHAINTIVLSSAGLVAALVREQIDGGCERCCDGESSRMIRGYF